MRQPQGGKAVSCGVLGAPREYERHRTSACSGTRPNTAEYVPSRERWLEHAEHTSTDSASRGARLLLVRAPRKELVRPEPAVGPLVEEVDGARAY